MSWKSDLSLVLVFSVAFSLASLTGPMSNNFHMPTVQLARANLEPCQTHGSGGACSQFWYPAGPEMNTELATIFTDVVAELTNLQSSSPAIDFPDTPLPPSIIPGMLTNPNFLVTAPIGEVGYYEIQFMLANNFWGCNFNFGNSACGVQIRQGIAHMIDKASFTKNEPSIAGISTPIDNPVPTTSGGGLTTPNPCAWDTSFPQSGPQCVAGAPGGTSYHLTGATGADGFSWLPAPGSPDLNAAAQHFVNAGVATGFNSTTSVLTGISSAAASNSVIFFIRNDDSPRLALGHGLAAETCYMFTGAYDFPCTYLRPEPGPIEAFPGFTTSTSSVSLDWWMYTAAYSGPTFFDGSLYFGYNSRFVSGIPSIQPPTGQCSAQAVPTSTAANYMYLCSPAYDNLSGQMESAPTLAQLVNLGVQTENNFGAGAFTIPIFEKTIQFGYANNGWVRVINDNNVGLPNYFTWLNAWNPAPALPATIRQGFSQTTRSVNPFIASTVQDLYIVGNVYDSLSRPNPLAPSQLLNWTTESSQQITNGNLTYIPPANTVGTYRITLRPDLFFQDGRPVTSYDVAFSYLSMVGTGAYIGTDASTMTGITILSPHQFDIGVNSLGPFVLPNLTGIPIVPGRYWTGAGSGSWDSAVSACTSVTLCSKGQYTLFGSTVNCALNCSPFSASLMTINPADVAATFDPIQNHIFVGSGPWQCGTVTSSGSGTCSTSPFVQNPPVGGSYTLTRFGNGLAPASSINGIYFRSAGNLALYLWSKQNNVNPLLGFVSVASCFNVAVNLAGPCGHFQQGIGNPGSGTIVGLSQVSISSRFYNLNWLEPYNWASNPPTGIGPLPPVLYEGSVTLNPASVVGCPSGYDC